MARTLAKCSYNILKLSFPCCNNSSLLVDFWDAWRKESTLVSAIV